MSEDINSQQNNKSEVENSTELLPRSSSHELIKHIPTDIVDTSGDEPSGQNITEISSSAIKPILQIESVF